MTDQLQDASPEESLPEESQDFRGIPEVPETVEAEGREEDEDEDFGDLDDIFDLYNQICTQMEIASTTLKGTFPLIDRLMSKISSSPDKRLDRRLRVATIIQTIGAAHSHLSRMARSARMVSKIQQDAINEAVDSPFE